VQGGVLAIWRTLADHPVKHNSQRPDVALLGVWFVVDYLRRHEDETAHTSPSLPECCGQSEVDDFGRLTLGDVEDVLELQVAVDDVQLVELADALEQV
jgi:hypothetical protein